MSNVGGSITSFGTVALGIFGAQTDLFSSIPFFFYLPGVAIVAFAMGFFGDSVQDWFERKYKNLIHKSKGKWHGIGQ